MRIFEGPVVTWFDDRREYGEERYISVGKVARALLGAAVKDEHIDFGDIPELDEDFWKWADAPVQQPRHTGGADRRGGPIPVC